jgi:hypothetical protein
VTAQPPTTTTSTTEAASSGHATSTTVPATDQEVGLVIGDPPPGVRCG